MYVCVYTLVTSVCVYKYVCMCDVCMCACMYVYVAQKTGCLESLCLKISHSVIYCSLVEFNHQKRSLLCQAGKVIRNHSNNYNGGTGEGFRKLHYAKPCLSTCNAATFVHCMQCWWMQNANMQLLCRSTILLQVQSLLTVLSVHSVCVLWNSSLKMASFSRLYKLPIMGRNTCWYELNVRNESIGALPQHICIILV